MFNDKKGDPECPHLYEPYMFELIQQMQAVCAVPERLIPRDKEVIGVYGIDLSGKLGYAMHVTNVGISDADIRRLVRW
jgi:hypothetical protein